MPTPTVVTQAATRDSCQVPQPTILHIMQCACLGGMEKATIELMCAIKGVGYENHLVSLHPIGGLGPLLKDRGISATGLEYRGPAGCFSIPRMAREFRRTTADGVVMVGHNLAAFTALWGLGCKKRLLFIHSHHRGIKPEWQWRAIYKAALRVFPRVAFCTDFIREEAEKIYPPLRAVSTTLRNPFQLPPQPTDGDKSAARQALGIPYGTFVVGNAGWLIERKRWDVFLKVAARIAKERSDVIFLLSGDGPLRDELRHQCIELGLTERVRWLGWQEDLTRFYLSLDVLLFNSDWDALGRTPLEAGANGVPTVASVLHGGLREVIDSEKVGFLIDQHDEELLAGKILQLLSDSTLRHNMGTACRRLLSDRHDPEQTAREVLRLLEIDS
jgi:glycosyltransferase involved in cell wall biosynthesis